MNDQSKIFLNFGEISFIMIHRQGDIHYEGT
jgi:hypothetical protein